MGDFRQYFELCYLASKYLSPNQKNDQVLVKESNALDLEPGVFTWQDPKAIAQSLARSAKRSHRRKGTPLQSAMSMLNFYINRAGGNLSSKRKNILEKAKLELRKISELKS